ncbi:TIGR04283 family arsenosugar biosynthesis glycosyltransferase [Allomuricauda sp. F6463D]|uniref:TIGR04283 family arsenosugar biosynthesis glycosyltransferase n=1 Tax=Allomuricauda sp. F6463D TaxID=2926409 RepID=UPI001FF516C2|nr:TIGR04283 family arsenosugar biosynthesis glycosyltransferase [Muricauda sp. F6463D]MCK0160019.1 TIGR04283 family arsenosugar biosynthesis glycosyltransferase [Muricauda sp. F6463D]
MISIIVPIYNESSDCIIHLIEHLNKNTFGHVAEVILVDGGGGSDNIKAKLAQYSDVQYVTSKKGRAIQMNHGAKIAKGNILYFLHADSFPPRHFDHFIHKTLTHTARVKAGCFILRFDSGHWWLKLMGWATVINHSCCRGGDQSLFVDSELFFALNGYDETYEVYEDNEFIQRLYKNTSFKVIRKTITTSARHYHTIGVWRLQWLHLGVYMKKWSGAGAHELSTFYKKHIEDLKVRSRT